MIQWSVLKNNSLEKEISNGSHKKVWWVCEKGHEWEAAVYSVKIDNKGCPYCSNQKVLSGFNDLTTTNPTLITEWDFSKNSLNPDQVTAGSNKKVWWVCEKGHEWEAAIKHRTHSNTRCTVCSNRQVLKNFNDLKFLFPFLISEWNETKNEIDMDTVVSGSHKKVWWVCEKGHEWEAKIVDRTRSAKGCPYCAGIKVKQDDNDFLTNHKILLNEWNLEKNIGVNPRHYTAGSNKKVWWKCEKGHEWRSSIADRTSGHGCKICKRSFSQPEEDITTFLEDLHINHSRNKKNIIKGELDIYIPEKNIAIEFNGVYWHSEAAGKGKYYHYDKWKACKNKGIQLIQIWEDEYKRNPELVKSMLAHKLGVTNQRKVFARKTVVIELTTGQSNLFLEQNHIQGAVNGGIRLGLIEKGAPGTVLAVMVLKREPGTSGKTLNLLRYATSANVVGGFTKLLKHVEKEYAPESIITFSDNCVSDGGLYLNNGFTAVKELAPDYMYVVKKTRIHKFNYRLKKFKEDPDLLFEEGFSERELAQLNNLPRIWDAGKIKWQKESI